MKPNEVFDKEEFIAGLLAIRAKPKPKPVVPTAQEKAQRAFAPNLKAMVEANAQSTRKVLERTEAELEEAERERDREQYRRSAEIANFHAVEPAYAQQQAEALASRRYDPTGNWAPPNYRSGREDW